MTSTLQRVDFLAATSHVKSTVTTFDFHGHKTKRRQRRVPHSYRPVFGLYPPRSPLRWFLWKWRVFFESTFALSMLEGWEKILIPSLMMRTVALMIFFWGLLITGIYRYLPYHLQFLYRRTVYYLSGTEQNDWMSVRGVGAAVLSTKAPHGYAAEL